MGAAQSLSDAASASPPGVGQQVASLTGDLAEYSICAGVPAVGPCSFRGQPAATDVEGAIAVDGNFTGLNFYIGDELTNTLAFAAAGNVSGSLAIVGPGNSGVYGGSNTAGLPPLYCPPSPGPILCPIPNLAHATTSPPLPAFSTINGALTNESTTLAALTSTASTIAWDQPDGTLVLTGNNTQQNVFDLATGELAGTTNLYVNVPPGSSTVINVPDTSVNCSSVACLQIVYFWDGSVYEAGNSSPSTPVQYLMANTVLNFPNATSVQLSAAGPSLNILAPQADFSFRNGDIYGFIYANQVNGTFESEIPPVETLPSTTTTTSSTTTSSTTTSSTTTSSTTTSPTTSSSSTTSTTGSSGTTSSTTGTTVQVPNTPGTVGTTTSTTLPTTTTPTTAPATATTAATTSTTAATTSTTALASTSTTVRTHAHSATTTTAPAATTTTAPAATTTTAPAATTTTSPAATTTTSPAATTTTAPAA
ncbi:MAG: choice-of-anchor A family protein, partial [Acidimicrobiales bacterium]